MRGQMPEAPAVHRTSPNCSLPVPLLSTGADLARIAAYNEEKQLLPKSERFFDKPDLVLEVGVFFQLLFHGHVAMANGGVITTTERFTELGVGLRGVCPREIHRDVSRCGQGACSTIAGDVGPMQVVNPGHGLDDVRDGNHWRVVRENTGEVLFGEGEREWCIVDSPHGCEVVDEAFDFSKGPTRVLDDRLGEIWWNEELSCLGFFCKDRESGLPVWRLDVCEEATLKPGSKSRL